MKKTDERFERGLTEIEELGKMIEQEGESSAKRRYKEIMAVRLLLIEESLLTIRRMLALGIGLLLGMLLGGLLR